MQLQNSPIDIYNDQVPIKTNDGAVNFDQLVIDLDLSSKKTLMELIHQVHNKVADRPADMDVIVYVVAGKQVSDSDWSELFDYISTLPNPITLIYRGYIHPETIKCLVIINKIVLDKNVKFVYIAEKVHILLKNVFSNPDIFRRILERWIEKYNEVSAAEYGIDELKVLGFEFNTL